MEIIRPENAYISAANCSKQLIFGDWGFFIMLFLNILSYPIISQIHLFMTSHFTTLLVIIIVVKGALSQIFSISLNSQNIDLCYRKPKNNGLLLLTIAILVF